MGSVQEYIANYVRNYFNIYKLQVGNLYLSMKKSRLSLLVMGRNVHMW